MEKVSLQAGFSPPRIHADPGVPGHFQCVLKLFRTHKYTPGYTVLAAPIIRHFAGYPKTAGWRIICVFGIILTE